MDLQLQIGSFHQVFRIIFENPFKLLVIFDELTLNLDLKLKIIKDLNFLISFSFYLKLIILLEFFVLLILDQ